MLIHSFNHLLRAVWIALPVFAVFAFFAYVGLQLNITSTAIVYLTSLFLTLGILFQLRNCKSACEAAYDTFLPKYEHIGITSIIVFGLALRLTWVLIFPTIATSDSGAYIQLANLCNYIE